MSEIVMYIIVNSDMKKLSPGKLAAQVAHSAVKASHLGLAKQPERWSAWYHGSYTKIVLMAAEHQIKTLFACHPEITVTTKDEGRTEIPSGTLTTLALIPMPKDEAQKIVGTLKLYG